MSVVYSLALRDRLERWKTGVSGELAWAKVVADEKDWLHEVEVTVIFPRRQIQSECDEWASGVCEW